MAISHDHYDHLDYPTIRELARTRVPFVTSLGVGAHLERWGVPPQRITELDWWETYALPGSDIEVSAAPSQHFSGRGLNNRSSTLWSSLVIRSPRLGEAIEPAHAERVEPWWRAVEASVLPQETTLPKSVPWPID